MVRIVENHDWVIFTLLGIGFVYIIMLNWLQRGESLLDFLFQEYSGRQNNILNWSIISIVFCVVFSVLFSQYIPVIPPYIAEMEVNGFVLNKIGMMIILLLLFYLLRALVTLLFFSAIGQVKKFLVLAFAAQRFYFVESLLLAFLCLVHYYYVTDKGDAYIYYAFFMLVFFVGKNVFYFLHREKPLPEEWYYKILYICGLQILPVLAIWKFIFI